MYRDAPWTIVLHLRRARQRRAAGARSGSVRRSCRSMSSVGLAWEARGAADAGASAGRAGVPASVAPLADGRVRHARRLSADALGDSRHAAGVRHARRRRLSHRAQPRAADQGRRRRGVAQASRIALGPLAGNPFPDATPEFFAAMARALSLGLDHPIEIATPFAHMHKEDVIRLGAVARRAAGAARCPA